MFLLICLLRLIRVMLSTLHDGFKLGQVAGQKLDATFVVAWHSEETLMQMHRRSAFVQRHRASMQHRCCPEGCAPHYPKRLFKPGMLRSPGHSEDLLYSSATSTSCAIPATRVTRSQTAARTSCGGGTLLLRKRPAWILSSPQSRPLKFTLMSLARLKGA